MPMCGSDIPGWRAGPHREVVGMMRDFVVANGARFMVGIQHRDEALTRYLEANRIPFVQLGGADFYTQGGWGPHWTPQGHQDVANRILGMLTANDVVRGGAAAKSN